MNGLNTFQGQIDEHTPLEYFSFHEEFNVETQKFIKQKNLRITFV